MSCLFMENIVLLKMDTSESTLEIPGDIWNLVVEKDGECQLVRSCEKWIVLKRVRRKGNILQTLKRRETNCIGLILCKNCLLNHVVEGKIEGRIKVTGRRGRRSKQLLNDLNEKSGSCKFKNEVLDRSLWRTDFERSYGRVVRLQNEWTVHSQFILYLTC